MENSILFHTECPELSRNVFLSSSFSTAQFIPRKNMSEPSSGYKGGDSYPRAGSNAAARCACQLLILFFTVAVGAGAERKGTQLLAFLLPVSKNSLSP